MSTTDDAREIIGWYTTPPTAEFVARDLKAEGCLVPDPQIIRTVEELEALDPDTLVVSDIPGNYGSLARAARYILFAWGDDLDEGRWPLPAVVVASGEHVRACREALGVETGAE